MRETNYYIELEGKGPDGLAMVYSERVDGLNEDAIHVVLKSDYDLLQGQLSRLNDVRMSEKSVWILRQKMGGKLHTYTSVDGQPSAAYVQYVPAADLEKGQLELQDRDKQWKPTAISLSNQITKLESELNFFKGCSRAQAFKISYLEEQLREAK